MTADAGSNALMSESKSRFVLLCQQAFACALVAALGVSAVGVVQLEIVAPSDRAPLQPPSAGPAALVSAAPVEPTVRTVRLAATTGGRSQLRAQSGTSRDVAQVIRVVSDPEPVTGFATVGVTWSAGAELTEDDLVVEVRSLTGGAWSPWQEMHFDPAHQPDPGTEGADVRSGTDAVVVGDVDDVQVRAVSDSGSAPPGLALSIVDPGEGRLVAEAPGDRPSPGAGPTYGDAATLSAAAMAVAPRPKIFSRAQWGADERLRDAGSLRYGQIHAGFVHHTVNANDYSREQVPSILRGIYAYHTQSRGWSDVGYNFLVDRFGQIWEGRHGGVDRPVIGAHTLGYNEEAFAMSAIGNFDVTGPSSAMVEAYGQLFAWKLSLHGVAADDLNQWVDDRALAAVNGHRDAGSTACPGRYLYQKLPAIRKLAAEIQRTGGSGSEPSPPTGMTGPGKALDTDISGAAWPDLVVRDASTGRATIVRTRGQLAFDAGRVGAVGWDDVDLVAAAGDLDGDGFGDLVARRPGARAAALHPGSAAGSFGAATTTFRRLARVDQLTGVGDFDGDGHDDLVGRRALDSALVLYRGRGDGTLSRPLKLADDWQRFDLTEGVDDVDGDDHPDLVARAGATLFLVPGTGAGVGGAVALPGRWDSFDVVAGRGDATGDGLPDLLVRSARTGTTYVHPGDGAGSWLPRVGGWTSYGGLGWLAIAQLVGGPAADLVGLGGSTGRLRVFPHTGRYNLGSVIDTGVPLDDVDLLLSVGDWDGDGRGDVMTRDSSSGSMQLRLGRKGGTFAAPVDAGTGWGSVSMVAAVGDVTGDGHPDLMARGSDGSDRVHPGNGRTGFAAAFVARPSPPGHSQVNLGMWDGDKIPDTAVRRADGTLWLWSSERSVATQLADGLRRYDWLLGPGDLDGDSRADLVVRSRTNGRLYLLPGRPAGFAPRRLIGTGFDRYDYAG